MRVGFQVVAVFESAGLAFVGVDRHESRRMVFAHDFPLATGRETGPAQAAQRGIVERGDDVLGRAFAGQAIRQQRITTGRAVCIEVGEVRHLRMRSATRHRIQQVIDAGVQRMKMPDLGHRRGVAPPHARRAHDARVRRPGRAQIGEQLFRPRQLASDAVAHPNGMRRRLGLALLDDVEVRVKRRHFINLGHRQLH